MVRQKGDNRFLGERSGISFVLIKIFHETAASVKQRDCNPPLPPRARVEVLTLVPEDLDMEGGGRGGRRGERKGHE